ncbi:MAG: hypothetical protein JWM80_108 [Cyanobacteria bacterium RYN_339]|nr:hypothetical protein [Cyanobacteria bacterium RYN_339]
MKAAIYVSTYAGPAYDEQLARAHAFCEAHGMVPGTVYPADVLRDKRQVEQLLAAAKAGRFEVLVAPFPDCFPTAFLKRLVAAGAGLACHNAR